ncbi:MAG: tryptophan synthase subunit alpha [Deltaproteobacteria bacterium]|nr:tryptophan synthase subunit alpha [Deltaproteobacteria bacterium]
MVLESYLRRRLEEKDILIMTHLVMGYPSFEECFETVRSTVKAGMDLMELQIPFSEPIADGPVILRACHRALKKGATVERCLNFAGEVANAFDIPFLIMSYYNIFFTYGIDGFASALAGRNLKGAIVPDLPLEEGGDYLEAMRDHGLAPVPIFSPTTPDERMRHIASLASGFIYCVSRKGITGSKTTFSEETEIYLERCRQATHLPLAVGFGVKEKGDMDFLKGKTEIAVIGTRMIGIMESHGAEGVGDFLRSLR